MLALARPRERGSCDCGLTVADPRVVRRYETVREDAKAEPLETATRGCEQPEVLEAAAGEDDGAWLGGLGARFRGAGGDALVERGRYLCRERPAARSSATEWTSSAPFPNRHAYGSAAVSAASCSSSTAA